MGQTLTEIAQTLKDANKKVQLIYAFNGTGKTRLSREFKRLIAPKNTETEELEDAKAKILTTMLLRKICSIGTTT